MYDIRSHAFTIFLAAAVFAVMGYYMFTWQYATATPPMVLLLKWTLRAGAIVFAVAGVLVLMRASVGLLLYGVSALIACGVCVAVTLWEVITPYHSGPGPLILIILAAWSGYTGVEATRHALAILRAPPAAPVE